MSVLALYACFLSFITSQHCSNAFHKQYFYWRKLQSLQKFKIEMVFANSHTSAYIFINVYLKSIGNNLVMKFERKILSIQKYYIIRKF